MLKLRQLEGVDYYDSRFPFSHHYEKVIEVEKIIGIPRELPGMRFQSKSALLSGVSRNSETWVSSTKKKDQQNAITESNNVEIA